MLRYINSHLPDTPFCCLVFPGLWHAERELWCSVGSSRRPENSPPPLRSISTAVTNNLVSTAQSLGAILCCVHIWAPGTDLLLVCCSSVLIEGGQVTLLFFGAQADGFGVALDSLLIFAGLEILVASVLSSLCLIQRALYRENKNMHSMFIIIWNDYNYTINNLILQYHCYLYNYISWNDLNQTECYPELTAKQTLRLPVHLQSNRLMKNSITLIPNKHTSCQLYHICIHEQVIFLIPYNKQFVVNRWLHN